VRDKILPQIIEKAGFDFQWSAERVWALKYPVEDMHIKELEWHLKFLFGIEKMDFMI